MLRLSAFPESGATDQVLGSEPWHIKPLLTDPDLIKAMEPRWASAEALRERGPTALSTEDAAFWHAYLEASDTLLAEGEPKDIVPEQQQHFNDVLARLSAFKTEAMVEVLKTDRKKAKTAMLTRVWDVGVFATKVDISLTALPEWSRAAVILNTKEAQWEILIVGHRPTVDLRLWLDAAVGGAWRGHRARCVQSGLPELIDLLRITNSLRSILEDRRKAS